MSLRRSIAAKSQALAAARARAESDEMTPRDRHEAGETAARLEAERLALEVALAVDDELAAKLDRVVEQLAGEDHMSRERALVLTKLEEAAMWLRKEAG